jgi:hypothetical protein
MSADKASSRHIGSAFDLLGKSAEIVKRNWKMFLLVNVLAVLAAIPPDNKNTKTEDDFSSVTSAFSGATGVEIGAVVGFGAVIVALVLVLVLFLTAMSVVLELRSSKGEKPSFSVLFDDAKKYWLRLLGLFILMGIIIIAGLILLIVPGIIAIKRLLYAPYIMVDKDLGIVDSLKASNELSKKHSDYTWAAFGVMVLISIIAGVISAFPFIGWLIGTVVAVAYSLVIPLRYLQLKKLPAHNHA